MSDAERPSPDAFDFVHDFVTASLQGELTQTEIDDFEALLQEDAALRRVYARYLETTAHIPRMLAAMQTTAVKLPEEPPQPFDYPSAGMRSAGRSFSTVRGFLNRALRAGGEMPAATALTWTVMAILCSGMVLTIFFCILLIFRGAGANIHGDAPQVAQQPANLPSPASNNLQEARGAAGEGRSDHSSLNPDPSTLNAPPSATVARLVQSYDCRWAIGSHSPRAGDDLEPGRKLVLTSGLAEIMFQSGVRTVLQGPAAMEIGSRTSAALIQGKLTVQVEDPDARGFVVRTPGMIYTDLGTEFGVWVAKDGTQEMHVFRGRVKAESLVPQPAALPLFLTANQAIRIIALEKPMERIAADDRQFVRLPQPFPIFSTGVGLDRGSADSHWEITRVSTDPNFRTQPAVVAEPLPFYLHDDRAVAQWISTSGNLRPMPGGCRWTYRTHFDLTGFDATTARVEGRIAADDYVLEMRLNGNEIPLASDARGRSLLSQWLDWKIEKGFAAGDNTLEIVVENSFSQSLKSGNVMALCVDCKGTARPQVKLRAEE